MISRLTTLLVCVLLLAPFLVAAQFGQFFEQMFHGSGGGQRSQQQERNVPSNSDWYRRNYDDGGDLPLSPSPPNFSKPWSKVD